VTPTAPKSIPGAEDDAERNAKRQLVQRDANSHTNGKTDAEPGPPISC